LPRVEHPESSAMAMTATEAFFTVCGLCRNAW